MAEFLATRIQQLGELSANTASSAAIDSLDAQDAVSCLYHILQLHGSYLARQCGSSGRIAIVKCGEAMLTALRVRRFPSESLLGYQIMCGSLALCQLSAKLTIHHVLSRLVSTTLKA